MSYAKDIFYFIVGVTIEESLTIAIICIAIGNRDIAIVLRSIVEVLYRDSFQEYLFSLNAL